MIFEDLRRRGTPYSVVRFTIQSMDDTKVVYQILVDYTEGGEMLYRIETHGRTGKTLYRNANYIQNGKELPVFGTGGSTGHGWGGTIKGYLTSEECDRYGVK